MQSETLTAFRCQWTADCLAPGAKYQLHWNKTLNIPQQYSIHFVFAFIGWIKSLYNVCNNAEAQCPVLSYMDCRFVHL